jgi:hypothetical protein
MRATVFKVSARLPDAKAARPSKLLRMSAVTGAPARPIASLCEKRCRLEAELPNARSMQGVYGWSLSTVTTIRWDG